MVQPKVSVIIPVYNVEKYLRQCLDSVVNQTLKDVEIICVDDGSTDCSLKILQEYAAADSRVKILSQKNQYAGIARNTGMDIAQGEYYVFLDSDDWFEITMLEAAYNKAVSTKADVVLWSGDYVHTGTKKVTRAPWLLNISNLRNGTEIFSWEDVPDTFFTVTSPAPWNKMFKAEFVSQHNIKFQGFSCSNDIYFTYSMLSLAKRIAYIPKEFVHYRIGNAESLQATKRKNPTTFLAALIAIKETLIASDLFVHLEKAFVNMALDNCAYNLRTVNDPDAYKKLCLFLNCTGFKALGIDGKPEDYFSNGGNYNEYKKAMGCTPDVSVIVPVYNDAEYVAQCLDSLLAQSLDNIEIICVNDGSTDTSEEVLRSYAEKHFNICVISLEENQGSFEARKAGIRNAHGKFIMFLDADDEYDETACEKAYRAAVDNNVDILQFGMKILPEAGVAERSVKWMENFMKPYLQHLHGKEVFEGCFRHSKFNFNITNKIFKADLCKNTLQYLPSRRIVIAEDLYFFFVMAHNAESYFAISDQLYVYHFGRGVMGHKKSTVDDVLKHCSQVQVGNLCLEFIEEQGESSEYYDVLRRVHLNLMGECLGVWRKLDGTNKSVQGAKVLVDKWGKTMVADVLMDTIKKECPEYFKQEARLIDPDDAMVPDGFSCVVPVVFATNDAYSIYAGVTIESILQHANAKNYYRIYILHDSLSQYHIEALEMIDSHQASVKCVDIGALIESKQATLHERGHFTKETYYRFVISEVFTCYKEVIYLDCDLVVTTDIACIIPTDWNGNLTAVVRNPVRAATQKRLKRDFDLDGSKYFNAGVLVINVQQWVEEQISERCFHLLRTIPKEKLVFCDQDILNVVCKDRAIYLDAAWNFCWNMVYDDEQYVQLCLPVVEKVGNQFHILHFASHMKPWSLQEYPLSRYFWKYARTSVFYEEILLRNFKRSMTQDIAALVPADNSTNKSGSMVSAAAPAVAPAVVNRGSDSKDIRIRQLEAQLKYSQQEIQNIHKSLSYRIGRAITWFPRKLRGGVRCYQEHGWSYTWERVLVHVGLK